MGLYKINAGNGVIWTGERGLKMFNEVFKKEVNKQLKESDPELYEEWGEERRKAEHPLTPNECYEERDKDIRQQGTDGDV